MLTRLELYCPDGKEDLWNKGKLRSRIMVIKHFSFTSLKVVFFPRVYKDINDEVLCMFWMRGKASRMDPSTFRKWKPFLLITYPPPSTVHFSREYFLGRERTMNAFKCHTTCLLQHLIMLVSNGRGDSFCPWSCIIKAPMLSKIQTLSLIDRRVEWNVEI